MTVPGIDNADRILDSTPVVPTTDFDIVWPVIATSEDAAVNDLVVLIAGVALDPSLYSFTGNDVSGVTGFWNGGTVSLDTAVSNQRVIIYSARAPRRTGNFLEGKSLPFSVLDVLMDDDAIQRRDTELLASRAFTVPLDDYIDNGQPAPGPNATTRAGRFAVFGPLPGASLVASAVTVSDLLSMVGQAPVPGLITTSPFTTLATADAAANGYALVSTKNLTVAAPLTLVSPLFAAGGVVTVNACVLTMPFASGGMKLFNCINGGQVIFTTPDGPGATILFCDPGDGIAHDCLSDLAACFASQPYDNAVFVAPPRRHHLSAPFTFPVGAWANHSLEAYGAVFDHAIRLPNPLCRYVGGKHDAALNPVPVGQKCSGFERAQDRGGSFADIKINNFPENAYAFGTHNAVAVADYQVQTGVFINLTATGNGRAGLYAHSIASLTPRSWFNENTVLSFGADQNGTAAVWLDAAAQYNTLLGHHTELNNRAWGFAIDTVVGGFAGGERVNGLTSGASAMVSRFSATAGALILYNIVGEFVTGETVQGVYTGATCNLVKHAATTFTIPGGVTGTFQTFETVTGVSGATGKVGDWDPASNVLNLYDVVGQFPNGDVVTGGTSGAFGTVSGLIIRINTDLVGDYLPGETVSDMTSGATALVVDWTHGNRHLEVTNVVGTFSGGHMVLGGTSGATGTTIGTIQGGGARGGQTQCQVLDIGAVTGGPFVAEELVTGALSGVTGYLFVTAAGKLGVRGINPNGDDFVFRVGETVTGATSLATAPVTGSHIGGGWSSQVYVTGGDNSIYHGLAQDEINHRFAVDLAAGLGPRTSIIGGRYAGDIHGLPRNFTGFQGPGTHVATQCQRVSVTQVAKQPRRITVLTATTALTPIVLTPADEIVHITNQSAAPVYMQWPKIPSPSQRIEIMDIGNAGADQYPIHVLNSAGAEFDLVDTKGGWSAARLIDAVNIRICP